MNNMRELETLLRSWKPRRVSPAVKSRLFAHCTSGGAAAVEPVPFRLSWLAPATVTLLLGCVLFNQHNAFVLGTTPAAGSFVAAVVSNQNAAAWLPGSFQRSHNTLPVDAFEWTHGNAWASNVSSSSASSRPN